VEKDFAMLENKPKAVRNEPTGNSRQVTTDCV